MKPADADDQDRYGNRVVSQPDRDSHTPAPVIRCAGFDHLVDAAKKREWEGDAERLRCLFNSLQSADGGQAKFRVLLASPVIRVGLTSGCQLAALQVEFLEALEAVAAVAITQHWPQVFGVEWHPCVNVSVII